MRQMFVTTTIVLAAVALRAAPPRTEIARADDSTAYALAEPGISPDGREIAFTSGGDVWSVPAAGGDARMLVADPAMDRRPLFSPDGALLAFVSTRTGGGDIYVLTLASGALRRLTFDDGPEELDGWSADGRWIYFSSTGRDIAGMNDVFRVSASGGTPFAVTAERYVNEFGGAPSPDGRRLLFAARGIASAQWWRRGSSHLDQSELWTRDLDGGEYTQIIERGARHVWPMWTGPSSIAFVSDRGGAENIWTASADGRGEARKITKFTDGRVLWPSITRDGRTVAFERDFRLWTLDVASGRASALAVTRRGAPTTPSPEITRQTSQLSDLALSPDGRKVAFVARGDVFAASLRDGGAGTRVTNTPGLESQPAWAPDSRRLVFTESTAAGQHLRIHDFTTNTTAALTSGAHADISPVFAPDGRRIAFLRNRRELRVLELDSRTERLVATGVLGDGIESPVPVWSPDGRWLAVFVNGNKAFRNVEIVPAAGGVLRPVSFLANVFANSIAWSRDGRYILFDTRQRTEAGELARVDLVPRTPRFREDLFRDLFSEPRRPAPPSETPGSSSDGAGPSAPASAAAPAPAVQPVEPDLAGIRQRLAYLAVGLDVTRVAISPDGRTAVVIAASAGQSNLYTWPLDDLATERPVARQITTTAGAKADVHFTPDSREVVYLDAGRIHIANLERRDSRAVSITAELVVDFAAERMVVFEQAWRLLRDHFYDPGFNGVDWEASREHYGPLAASASTPEELRRVMSLMIGDLNASHLGVSAAAPAPVVGRLGLDFDRSAFESGGRLVVTHVVPLGPAHVAGGIAPGDVIAAIDGRPVTAGTALDEVLAHAIDRRVVLSVRRGTEAARDIAVRPVNQTTGKALRYREWVERNRAYVLKASGGRLGYVHMINMSAAALDQLHIDLDVENHTLDGVVIDIRNNSGGFVNAYALDVFTRMPYLRMSTRNIPEAPARAILGQRALESPTILVTNQHSLSDAEDFTEGYRRLKLGQVVGEPTAGWIIYTWDTRLVDGSTLRLPRMRVRGGDNRDMENVPRPVNVEVARPLGESAAGRDSQLDEAIRQLLRQLGRVE